MSRIITVTQALSELKLYDAKITKKIEGAKFVSAANKSSDVVDQVKRSEFERNAESDWQSVNALIANRAGLKAAIALSNAKTFVKIGDVEMTVAEAIERKTSIVYEQELLSEMKDQFADAKRIVEKRTAALDAETAEFLKNMYAGKESQVSEDAQKAAENAYRASREYALADPLGLDKKIRELEDRIDSFVSNVDIALSISNSTTFIEVE